ncbi:hypothetical protein YC2023_074008 [Brassica napus]
MFSPVSANAGNPPPKCNKPTVSSLPLPDDISMICLAYVPRCDHPSLSEVCKTFNQIIASSELNRLRSLHKSTENVLYLGLRFSRDQKPIWYTLNQKPSKEESNSLNHKLVPYPSFPCLPCWGSNVIVIGQEMYVFGGCIDDELTTDAFAIDCITRTCRSLPSMRVARGCAAFGVVDEKIYVLGGCNKKKSSKDWLEVFDLKNQTWESFPGVDEDLPDMRGIQGGSRMVNHGGKLVILFKRNESGETKIWCTEIALERRGQGEHWGKVLWTNIVATFENSPTIVQCLDVII